MEGGREGRRRKEGGRQEGRKEEEKKREGGRERGRGGNLPSNVSVFQQLTNTFIVKHTKNPPFCRCVACHEVRTGCALRTVAKREEESGHRTRESLESW